MERMYRFAIVAGEASGDILGAALISSLKKQYPNAIFEGIGGPLMINQGCRSFFSIDVLSVMGFIEPLKKLPQILRIQKYLKKTFLNNPPDVFIGIDAPDFNLNIELALKKHGIKTVHFVSPTVWAWRKKRIHKIKKAVSLMLTLFPFETGIYQTHQIPVCYTGHPLADEIAFSSCKIKAREQFGLPLHSKIVALLPGSRFQELKYLTKDFIATAKWLKTQIPDVQFISACINDAREMQMRAIMKQLNFEQITIFQGKSREVMAASDAIIVASGTASLEAMLIKRPTLIAYKMGALTYAIAKRLVKIPYIGLPNLLANKLIMPEFIQDEVKPVEMGKKILPYLNGSVAMKMTTYEEIHIMLKKDASKRAAEAIGKLLYSHPPLA